MEKSLILERELRSNLKILWGDDYITNSHMFDVVLKTATIKDKVILLRNMKHLIANNIDERNNTGIMSIHDNTRITMDKYTIFSKFKDHYACVFYKHKYELPYVIKLKGDNFVFAFYKFQYKTLNRFKFITQIVKLCGIDIFEVKTNYECTYQPKQEEKLSNLINTKIRQSNLIVYEDNKLSVKLGMSIFKLTQFISKNIKNRQFIIYGRYILYKSEYISKRTKSMLSITQLGNTSNYLIKDREFNMRPIKLNYKFNIIKLPHIIECEVIDINTWI
jgi:hypothetical protein